MPKHSSHDNIMMRPLPSARFPWLVIFMLLAAIVLVYLGFLRPKEKLLGPSVHDPAEYLQYMQPQKPAVVQPAPVQPTPPQGTPHGQ